MFYPENPSEPSNSLMWGIFKVPEKFRYNGKMKQRAKFGYEPSYTQDQRQKTKDKRPKTKDQRQKTKDKRPTVAIKF